MSVVTTKADNMMKAKHTLDYLGGVRTLKDMVNAQDFYYDESSVSFHFDGFQKANVFILTLDTDGTHNMKLMKLYPRKMEFEEYKEVTGLLADEIKQVFEDETCLYLSLR